VGRRYGTSDSERFADVWSRSANDSYSKTPVFTLRKYRENRAAQVVVNASTVLPPGAGMRSLSDTRTLAASNADPLAAEHLAQLNPGRRPPHASSSRFSLGSFALIRRQSASSRNRDNPLGSVAEASPEQ
jgi:hypothetical protein